MNDIIVIVNGLGLNISIFLIYCLEQNFIYERYSYYQLDLNWTKNYASKLIFVAVSPSVPGSKAGEQSSDQVHNILGVH